MNFSVRGDRCLILLDDMKKTKTVVLPSGETMEMALPDQHSERSRTAVIKACGDKAKMYKVGERVVVSVYAGTRIHLLGEEFEGKPINEDTLRVIREEEIIAVIE